MKYKKHLDIVAVYLGMIHNELEISNLIKISGQEEPVIESQDSYERGVEIYQEKKKAFVKLLEELRADIR